MNIVIQNEILGSIGTLDMSCNTIYNIEISMLRLYHTSNNVVEVVWEEF
jgi:hypothetical protein